MNIKQINAEHVQQFCDLIVDMYSNLENLEWFSPMPFDIDNVKSMIENPRFYIVGAFEDNLLCGVASLDYKCGKLIGKIELPEGCNTEKLVEFGFTMVRSTCRGKGIMKQMLLKLLEKIKKDGFEWAFGKVHHNNLASSKSFVNCGFSFFSKYNKPVKLTEFLFLSSQDFFSPLGKKNADITLAKVSKEAEIILVDYDILVKKL